MTSRTTRWLWKWRQCRPLRVLLLCCLPAFLAADDQASPLRLLVESPLSSCNTAAYSEEDGDEELGNETLSSPAHLSRRRQERPAGPFLAHPPAPPRDGSSSSSRSASPLPASRHNTRNGVSIPLLC
jgi:hypothetical protein